MFLKKLIYAAVAVIAIVSTADAQQRTTIRMAIGANDGDGGEILGMRALKAYVEFRSAGAIEVRQFFNTMGGSLQVTEAVKNGTLEMALTDDSVMGSFHRPMEVFQIPYLFSSAPVAWEFMNGEFARGLTDEMRRATGIRTLAFSENGFRNMTNNVRALRTPDDMRGLKMRTMQSQVYVSLMRSLGASATPIAWPELIPALRQNVVDGQENSAATILDGRLFEVQRFMSITEHVYGMHLIIVNDAFFQRLSPEHRRILMDGARMHAQTANSRKAMDSMQAVDRIRQQGTQVHVNTAAEREAFRRSSQQPVIEFIASRVGAELVQRVLAEAQAAERRVYGDQ